MTETESVEEPERDQGRDRGKGERGFVEPGAGPGWEEEGKGYGLGQHPGGRNPGPVGPVCRSEGFLEECARVPRLCRPPSLSVTVTLRRVHTLSSLLTSQTAVGNGELWEVQRRWTLEVPLMGWPEGASQGTGGLSGS